MHRYAASHFSGKISRFQGKLQSQDLIEKLKITFLYRNCMSS